MRITLSFATTADGYLDDNTPERLILSSKEDWDEVYRLRAACDAILVGAETVRRDNPSLRGVATRVTLTRSGALDPSLRLFTTGDGRRIVFSPRPLPQLDGLAEVVVLAEPITAAAVAVELERHGIRHLLVEGGAEILGMFLHEGLADTVRVAVRPDLVVGAERGGARFCYAAPREAIARKEELGGVEVTTYTLRADRSEEELRWLDRAIDESRKCPVCNSCYRVGAVIRTADGQTFTGYTHETSPTHHAEQEAILKACAAGAELGGATIFSSMEPCSKRASEPESCTELILRHGFRRVVFACYEPDCFVRCEGALRMRQAGVEVCVYTERREAVLAVNAHLWGERSDSSES